jgi:type VI secretion system protein ImpA
MPNPDLESLLTPLAADAPCGADPQYDPAFLALLEACARKPERQYGKTVIPPEEPDWPAVHQQALELAARMRDLRVAVLLARSGARALGLPGAAFGLRLARGLLDRWWDAVHPRLDADDADDPTTRINALMPLVHPDAGLADLRAASLTGRRGAVTVRDIELALARGQPVAGEGVPTEDGVLQGIAAAAAESARVPVDMREAFEAAQGLVAALESRLGDAAPDLAALTALLQPVAEAARRLPGGQAAGPAEAGAEGAAAAAAAGAGGVNGPLVSREDVIRALDRACEWIERNEPTNPAPLLIRRSQRLMTKNFIDIIRDLAPESLTQIEKLAGPPNP